MRGDEARGAGAGPWGALAALVVVGASACAVLLASGVTPGDTVRWLWVLGAGVVLPGFVLARVVRGPGAVEEDLAWSLPLGLVLALVTWGVGLATGSPLAPPWTGAVALVALAVPAVRRRVLAPSVPGWGAGSGAVVAVSLVVTSAWAAGSALSAFPLTANRPVRWAPDVMFHEAMAGELTRTAVPTYPMVPEGPYPYHWFFHALAAHLGQGAPPLVVVTHLLPLTLLLAVVAMAAVAARVVAGHRWGAAVGATTLGLVGATQPGAFVVLSGITGRSDTDGAGLDPVRLYWQHSASTTLGWLAALGVVAVAAGVLRGRMRAADAVLLLLLGTLAAGAKSSQPPVLLCGLAVVVALEALRRRWSAAGRAALVGSLLLAPWVVALLTMYAGGSQGLVLDPGQRVEVLVRRLAPDLAAAGSSADGLAAVTAVVLWLLPLVPRLLGLLWWVRRPVDPVGVLCAATVAAGAAGTFLTSHPGGSEVFLLVSAYPVGVVGSAAGLCLAVGALVQRWGARRVAVSCALAALVGGTATVVLAARAGSVSPVLGWRRERPDAVPGSWLPAGEQLMAWAGHSLLLGAVLGALGLLVLVVGGRPTREGVRRRVAGILVVTSAALLGGGLVATGRDVAAGRPGAATERVDALLARSPARSFLLVTPALWDAAALVRRDAGAEDVVVTNRACTQPATVLERRPCDPREFSVAALTGRRTGVSGWAYAPTSLARARDVEGGYTRMPFWDPARLAEQRALVEEPTPERATAAWARGERWVLADRAAGPVSEKLAEVGDVVLDRDGVVLVRLTPPR